MLEACFRIILSGQRRHRAFVEDGLVLAVIGRCALVDRLRVGEFRRVKINFSFDNFEVQDEISSDASAFQREEVVSRMVKDKQQGSAAVGNCSAVFRWRVSVHSTLLKESRFTAAYT